MNGGPASIKVFPPYFVCIPCGSSIRLEVTAYGWGVGKGAKTMIALHDNCWMIAQSDPLPYFLQGTFTANAPTGEYYDRLLRMMRDSFQACNVCPIEPVWAGTLKIPRTAIDILKRP